MTPGSTAFFGLSHLGVISAAGWASFGQPVVGVDPDAAAIAALEAGRLPVHEPGLPELWARARPHLRLTPDPAALGACELVVISQDVPTDTSNVPDLSPVVRLVDLATPHLCDGAVLVIMSQVSPGFTRGLGERVRRARPDLRFALYYWVETLIFGDAVRRFLQPERLIIGCADPAVPLPAPFETALRRFGRPILPMRYESAELTKTAINLYLAASVTYANTLADLSERVGADWAEIVPALRLDARIGPAAYLRPSLGVAGGNLERDLAALQTLCQATGADSALVDTLVTFNRRRYRWVLRQLHRHVLGEDRPRIGVWGLTYKRDTRSTKNSPALRLIADLAGAAELRAWDPVIRAGDATTAATIVPWRDDVLDGADGLVIMADWDDFRKADLDALRRLMRRPVIVDCVGALEARADEMDGIRYVAMGRGLPAPPAA